MRKILKWRYYCDFCKKSGCSGGHLAIHEKHCTANPGRECRMCKLGELEQQPIDALIAALGVTEEGGDIGALERVAQGCPACMLAALVQDRKRRGVARYAASEDWNDFDYAKRAKSFMDDACAVEENYG